MINNNAPSKNYVDAQNAALMQQKWMTGNKLVLFGDSVIYNNGPTTSGTATQYSSKGWFNFCNYFLNQAFNVIANKGVGGNNSIQLLARIDADVIALQPDYCVLPLTTNDFNNLEDVVENISARYIQMFNKLSAAGIKVITTTCLASDGFYDAGDTTKKQLEWYKTNKWLRNYCQNNPNIIMVDLASVDADPSTGRPLTGETDGTHPYGVMCAKLGKLAADTLKPYIKINDIMPCVNNDPTNLLTNGLMIGDTGGVATGWTIAGTGSTFTPSKEVRVDDKGGQIQVVAVTVKAESNIACQSDSIALGTKFTTGDLVQSAIEFEVKDASEVDFFYLQLVLQTSAYGTVKNVYGLYKDVGDPAIASLNVKGTLITPPVEVTADTARMRMQMRFNGVGTFKIGKAYIWKVE